MALPRFYLPPQHWPDGAELPLLAEEALHCLRVLRCQAGEAVEVFDGAGRVATGRLNRLSASKASVRVEQLQTLPQRPVRIILQPALIKTESFEWLLEKATELGVSEVQPMITQQTAVSYKAEQLQKKQERWQRHMVEAAKQCHTPWLPILRPPVKLDQHMRQQTAAGVIRLMPSLAEQRRWLHEISFAQAHEVQLMIGPEGDFTREEEQQAQAQGGYLPITLGPLILRAETASLTALAQLQQELARAGRC
jgi:16S rRNA (uracil1498-N3)-methyltransferase